MAMRATTAAAAASLRAAGVLASSGGRVPVPGGGGGVSGLIYGHQATRSHDATSRLRAVEAAARGGGTRSFFSFGKGRGSLATSRIAEGDIKNEQLLLENSADSTQTWKVSQLKLELSVEKALSRQRIEYEAKLAAIQKDYEAKLAAQKRDFDSSVADAKKEFDEKIKTVKARQNECFSRIVEVETDIKMLSQKFDNFKDSLETYNTM